MRKLVIPVFLSLLTGCGHKAPPPGKPDTLAPVIRIIYPAEGDTVKEDTVYVKAEISDSSKVTRFQLILDGNTAVTTSDTDSLFFTTGSLEDTLYHSIILRAMDEWDNWGTSPPVKFFIKK